MYQPQHSATFGRLGRKVAAPIGDAPPWGAPPIPDLIAAIDAVLKRRAHC